MRVSRLTLIGFFSLFLSGCATQSTNLDSINRWHPRDEYFQTLDTESLELQASAEDHEAVFHLAIRLMNGDRIGRDEQRAVQIVRESAEDGYAPAQYLLGAALAGD